MQNVHKYEINDVISDLPEIKPLDVGGQVFDDTNVIFLCALGFEPRCLVIPEALQHSGFRSDQAIYFEYSTNLDDNAINRSQLVTALSSITSDVKSLPADETASMLLLKDKINDVCLKYKKPLIVFDVSVVANRLLMRCMKVLMDSDVRLRLLYSEAEVYYPTLYEYQSKGKASRNETRSLGLEVGVGDVLFSDEHPGYHIDALPDCILLFPSFSKDRSWTAINRVDPTLVTLPSDKIVWFLGLPHLSQDHWRLEAQRAINSVEENFTQYEVSTFDYKESLRLLDRIYTERIGQYNFTLAPMGSKLQAVGAALFCYIRPDVRVIFATPQVYNGRQYSSGCKATWSVDFGSLTDVKSLLDKVGLIEITSNI